MVVMKTALVGRVGGLAAVLGAGVVIGFATCAQASAAPTDPTGPSARADSGQHTAAPARRASAGNRDPARARIALRSATAPRAGTLASATVAPVVAESPVPEFAVPEFAVPELAVPVPWRQARTAIAKPPASVADAATVTFPWSDPRGRQITIYKGTHFAIPNSFGYFIQQTVGTGTFISNSAYDLKDIDQYDWNKFTGIAFTPLEPDRDAAMVGWRYNLTTLEFEIAPFYNVNKARILPNENPLSPGYEVISVPVGETFEFAVDYSGITLSYGGRTVYKPYPSGLTPNVWTAARVSGWFGGNEVAPRTLSYFLRLD
jgi:hypothetical protein